MGRKALICESVSNGIFLVDDCIAIGLDPVVIYPPIPEGEDTFAGHLRKAAEPLIAGRAEILRPKDFDDLLRMLEGYDIACMVVGSEYGIPYCDRLSEALGIPGNDPSTTFMRTDKRHMHEGLAKAGLRHIRTVTIRDEEDIRGFWIGRPAVVKPSAAVGTIGVHVCDTLDSCIEAYRSVASTEDWTGGSVENVIIQDYIGGAEYIVNTVSREGVHRITDMWMYWKQNVGAGVAYDCAMSVSDPGERELRVAEYALKVLDALGVTNGPTHMELKSDDEGPVLIEINARPMGGHFSRGSLDIAIGHHITDLALRIALDPEAIRSLPEGIPPMKRMALKVLILHEDRTVDIGPLEAILSGMRSYRGLQTDLIAGNPVELKKTEDLVSSPGSVELLHNDAELVMDDFALLSAMEKSSPDLLYGFSVGRRDPISPMDIEPGKGTMVLDDDGISMPDGTEPDSLLTRVSDMPLTDFYEAFEKALRMLPRGGRILVDPCVYRVVPYGRKGLNSILMLHDLEFDISIDESQPIEAVKGY